jgi:copper chaperone CopZ
MTKTIKLSGLTCPACKKLIEKRIATISGVRSVEVVLNSGDTTIQADRDIQLSKIKEVLKNTPYQIIN